MVHRAIRDLPFPPVSTYTPEIVAQIKAIPDEEIQYTEKEIAWMHRGLENLNYMFIHARNLCLNDSIEHINSRIAWINRELANCEEQRRRKT